MPFSDGIPQAVDVFPYIVLAVIAVAAVVGLLRRRSRTKE
jgi:hypothetical protein